MSERNLHITVAAAPNLEIGNPRILEHDLRLLKASILYADKVKLCRMAAWMATSFHLIGNLAMSIREKFDIIMSFAPIIASQNPNAVNLNGFQKIQTLLKRNPVTLTKKERLYLSRFKERFPEMWDTLSVSFNEILRGFGFDELELAAQQGLLEIHPFSSIGDDAPKEYIAAVEEMLRSNETHPMLDEQTNDLVRLGLREGKISVGNTSTQKGKQIGLVGDLFDRLPIFDIPMDELLDVRNELQRSLLGFRSEMIYFSKDIESARWDEDVPSDVQAIYQSKVEPALLEIEDKLRSTSFREFWSRRIVDKFGYLAGSYGGAYAFGAAVSPLLGIATALAATAVFTEAGQAELREKVSEIERNGL